MSKALQAFNETLKKAGIKNVSGVTVNRTISNAETGVVQQVQLKNVSNTADMMSAIESAEEPVFSVKCQEVIAGQKDQTSIKKPLSRKEAVNVIRVWDGLQPLPESEIFSNPDGVWSGELYIVDKDGVHSMRPVSLLPDPNKTDQEMIDAMIDAGDYNLRADQGEKLVRFVIKDTVGAVVFDKKF